MNDTYDKGVIGDLLTELRHAIDILLKDLPEADDFAARCRLRDELVSNESLLSRAYIWTDPTIELNDVIIFRLKDRSGYEIELEQARLDGSKAVKKHDYVSRQDSAKLINMFMNKGYSFVQDYELSFAKRESMFFMDRYRLIDKRTLEPCEWAADDD